MSNRIPCERFEIVMVVGNSRYLWYLYVACPFTVVYHFDEVLLNYYVISTEIVLEHSTSFYWA
jgi:hypothetical protein